MYISEPADTPKPEFMLAAEEHNSSAFAPTRVWHLPIVDWGCCIVGEGVYVVYGLYPGIFVITTLDIGGLTGVGEFSCSTHGCAMLTML